MNKQYQSIPIYSVLLDFKTKDSDNEKEYQNHLQSKVFKTRSLNNSRKLWQFLRDVISIEYSNNSKAVALSIGTEKLSTNAWEEINFENIQNIKLRSCDILCGNISGFSHVVPLSSNLYWFDSFNHSTFIILFNSVFSKILSYTRHNEELLFTTLSNVTSNKVVTYPFFLLVDGKDFEKAENSLRMHKKVFEKYVAHQR